MTIVESRVKSGSLSLGGEMFSCQPTNVTITPDHEGTEEDSVEVLCGDTLAGSVANVLTANLTSTSIQDFTNPAGLIAYSWAHDGEIVDFTWSPTSDTDDAWTGKVTVGALLVGGDVNTRITTDMEWKITELTTPVRLGSKLVIGSAAVAITGVTAGTPGSFQPSDATLPANLTALKADPVVGDTGTSKPSAAWTTGQWVVLGDASEAHWDGTAWAAGKA